MRIPRPRGATAALMFCAALLAGRAEALRLSPPVARSFAGPVLGIETLVLPGATAVSWKGPFGREARVTGEGRFEGWRHPLWSGEPSELAADGADVNAATVVVDHPLRFGECLGAAVAQAPVWSGLLLVALVLAIVFDGTVAHAAVLAFGLGMIRALSPAWSLVSDPARYWASAGDILGGHLPDALWPPAWPVVLAPAAAIGEADPLAGRILGVVLVACCPILAARVVSAADPKPRTWPLPAPLAAALVTALSFELLGFAPSLYAEPLFVALGLATLAATTPARAGLLGAAMALTRAHALAVAPLVAFSRLPRPRFRYFVLLLLPVALWSGARSLASGRAVLISENAGMNLWIGHRPGADGDWHDPGPPPPEGYGTAAVAAIRADPGGAALRVVKNVGRLWNASRSDPTLATRPLPVPLLPFAGLVALAAIGAVKRPRLDLVIWLVATTALTALFFVPVRYKLGLYPALLPLAGLGLSELASLASYAAKSVVDTTRPWSRRKLPYQLPPPGPPNAPMSFRVPSGSL